MGYQLNQFLKSRNNRIVVLIVLVLLTFTYLRQKVYVSHTIQENTTTITSNERILYTFPKAIIDRLSSLETKVENISSIFEKIQNFKENNIVSTFFSNFIDENVDSFWRPDGVNETLSKVLYGNDSSNEHQTVLVTKTQCKQPLKLLILITTHATHFEQRNSIRSTWGRDPKKEHPRWKTYFLIGRTEQMGAMKKIHQEIETHDDLIIGNVQEHFYNLTYKVQMGFEWSLKYCQYEFMLKGDDDVFVNLPQLFQFLESDDTPKKELFAGNVQYQAKVFRTGKYGVDKNEFRKAVYPRYCSGGGFVLSRDVVDEMVKAFHQVPALKIDDAYIGVLALKIGIDVLHNNNFRMFEDDKNENKCVYNKESIVHHPVKLPSCMEALFKESLKGKF